MAGDYLRESETPIEPCIIEDPGEILKRFYQGESNEEMASLRELIENPELTRRKPESRYVGPP